MNIRSLNLNLVPVLHALLAERSVTRAAVRLGMSQPATSNALGQLRAHFNDVLLVRSGAGMVPTERALALVQPLADAVAALEAVFEPAGPFDAACLERTFTLATTDYVGFVLVPVLLARLARVAPGVRLHVQSWPHHRVPSSLERGDVDLMLGFYADVPAGHHHEALFSDEFVCIVSKHNPHVGKRLSLAQYLRLEHVVVTQERDAPGVVDEVLAKRGLHRTVGLRLSHFLSVPPAVARTDFVAALDRRVAMPFAKLLPLRVCRPPIPLPSAPVRQVWHERTHGSAPHAWLRSILRAVAQGI